MILQQYFHFPLIVFRFLISKCSILIVFLIFYTFSTNKYFFNYTILSALLTFFLNPQQTKYFGGLAIELKQVGLFSKYSRSEQMVSIFSWFFIFLFLCFSFFITKILKNNSFLIGAGG
jgi:hypothetical protein